MIGEHVDASALARRRRPKKTCDDQTLLRSNDREGPDRRACLPDASKRAA